MPLVTGKSTQVFTWRCPDGDGALACTPCWRGGEGRGWSDGKRGGPSRENADLAGLRQGRGEGGFCLQFSRLNSRASLCLSLLFSSRSLIYLL